MIWGATLHKIAIVEGDQTLRQMYELKLRQTRLQIETAGDGYEAFKLLKKFQPDLVMMDIKLSHLSGIEVMKKYLLQNDTKPPRLILASNYDESFAQRMFLDLHVDKYIVKAHHTPSQIVGIVKSLLPNSQPV